jgi:hypothetical protein
VQTAPTEMPVSPTPPPVTDDQTKKKAKVKAKKVNKKSATEGTSKLATKKPATGGLKALAVLVLLQDHINEKRTAKIPRIIESP